MKKNFNPNRDKDGKFATGPSIAPSASPVLDSPFNPTETPDPGSMLGRMFTKTVAAHPHNPGNIQDFLRWHGHAVESGMYRHMPVMPGAVEGLQRLHADGVSIRVTTHRLLIDGQDDMVKHDTQEWLAAHNIPYDHIEYTGDKHLHAATVHIDDAPDMVNKLREHGQQVVVFDQPYNRGLGGTRARDWGEAPAAIMSHIPDSETRPVLSLDLDGVTGDYTEALASHMSTHTGIGREHFPDPTSYNLSKVWNMFGHPTPAYNM